MAFDRACYALAASFLDDNPGINTAQARDQLAQAIQRTIDDWIEAATEVHEDRANASPPEAA
jgi:hypothetical protein